MRWVITIKSDGPSADVARLSKAKRGKRRWVGLSIPDSISTRADLRKALSHSELFGDDWKLADFSQGKAIVRISLSAYNTQKEELMRGFDGIKSLTASGKIRLVRERLGLEKPPRRK